MTKKTQDGPDEASLLILAGAVADGSEVDWAGAESSAGGPEQRDVIRSLRALARLASLQRSGVPEPPATPAGSAFTSWGPLEIRGEVGRGVFGTAFRAWDPRLEREVALKLLHDGPATEDVTPVPATEDVAPVVINEGSLLAR